MWWWRARMASWLSCGTAPPPDPAPDPAPPCVAPPASRLPVTHSLRLREHSVGPLCFRRPRTNETRRLFQDCVEDQVRAREATLSPLASATAMIRPPGAAWGSRAHAVAQVLCIAVSPDGELIMSGWETGGQATSNPRASLARTHLDESPTFVSDLHFSSWQAPSTCAPRTRTGRTCSAGPPRGPRRSTSRRGSGRASPGTPRRPCAEV